MSLSEFIIKLSQEGRAWLALLMPLLMTFLAGWHLPQPSWMKKD